MPDWQVQMTCVNWVHNYKEFEGHFIVIAVEFKLHGIERVVKIDTFFINILHNDG